MTSGPYALDLVMVPVDYVGAFYVDTMKGLPNVCLLEFGRFVIVNAETSALRRSS